MEFLRISFIWIKKIEGFNLISPNILLTDVIYDFRIKIAVEKHKTHELKDGILHNKTFSMPKIWWQTTMNFPKYNPITKDGISLRLTCNLHFYLLWDGIFLSKNFISNKECQKIRDYDQYARFASCRSLTNIVCVFVLFFNNYESLSIFLKLLLLDIVFIDAVMYWFINFSFRSMKRWMLYIIIS